MLFFLEVLGRDMLPFEDLITMFLCFKSLQFYSNTLQEYLQRLLAHSSFVEDGIIPKRLFVQDLIFQLLCTFNLLNFILFVKIQLAFFLLKVV